MSTIIRPAFKQAKKVVTFIHKLLDVFSETIKAGSRSYLIYCLLLSTNYLGWGYNGGKFNDYHCIVQMGIKLHYTLHCIN